MARGRSDTGGRRPLPDSFETLHELWEFWDTHSTADYEDLMETVEIKGDVRSSKVYGAVAKDLLEKDVATLEARVFPPKPS